MSAPDVAAFGEGTAELDRIAGDLAVAEQALTGALASAADAEARLRITLSTDGDGTSSLAKMEQAVRRVDQIEVELAGIFARAMAAIATGYI